MINHGQNCSIAHDNSHAFGNLGAMIAFGSLAVVNLYLYWSSIGSWLDDPQSTSGGEIRGES